MTRRIYDITAQRKRLVREALDTVRQTRETIDPALLQAARSAIGSAAERQQARETRPMQLERVAVDRKKALSVALKFLEIQPENKALQREISSFLAQH